MVVDCWFVQAPGTAAVKLVGYGLPWTEDSTSRYGSGGPAMSRGRSGSGEESAWPEDGSEGTRMPGDGLAGRYAGTQTAYIDASTHIDAGTQITYIRRA